MAGRRPVDSSGRPLIWAKGSQSLCHTFGNFHGLGETALKTTHTCSREETYNLFYLSELVNAMRTARVREGQLSSAAQTRQTRTSS